MSFGWQIALQAESKYAVPFTFTTLAGSPGNFGATDGTGPAARFFIPSDLALDGSGNLYVTDMGNRTIRRITTAGEVTTVAGSPGDTGSADGNGAAARFAQPAGIAIASSGEIYVADQSNHTIRKITPSGNVTTIAGSPGSAGFTDGLGTSARFNTPYDVAVDNAGNVYVADSGNNALRKISPAGDVSTLVTNLNFPTGLILDDAKFLYVANTGDHTILKITATGTVAILAGSVGRRGSADGIGTAALFDTPASVSLDHMGNIFVPDFTNHTIRRITADGVVTTIAGSPGISGSTDGTGAFALFNRPYGITSDNSGRIYVTDYSNHTIRIGLPPSSASPVIITHPESQSVVAGQSAILVAAADGVPAPTYQWRKNGADISGATSSSFTIAGVTAGDAGGYAVVATNSVGFVTSNIANLTITSATVAPSFTLHPANQSVAVGGSVTFSAAASGTPAPAYQWQKDGVNISGATGTSFTITSVTAGDAGAYTVVASNSAGSATSNVATLNITFATLAPSFSVHPASLTALIGNPVTFSSVADGSPAPTFQWQKDGANISGATNAFFTITSVAASDAGSYRVIATNSVGSVVSNVASLTIATATSAPSFTMHPTNQSVAVGGSVTFTAAASGTPAPAFQWRKDGANISGATNSSLTIASVTPGDAGAYSVVAANTAGSVTSNTATLSVPIGSLANETVTTGHNVSFTASARGSIRWQVSSDSGTTWTDLTNNSTYSGVATSSLLVTNATQALNGLRYRFTATENGAVAISPAAVLTVTPAHLPFPTSITVDSSGNLFVGDANTNTICRITATGIISIFAGSTGTSGTTDGAGASARFNQPNGLTALTGGELIVSDTANATLRRITGTGSVTTLAGSSISRGNIDANTGTAATFSSPIGITADTSGVLYVADAMNHTIRRVTTSGATTTIAGMAGVSGFADGVGTAARFNYPSGIAVDAAGNLYVADTHNNLVRKISPTGAVTTVAGVQNVAGYDDGTGTTALFNRPCGLAIDGSGNLYLADTGNSAIRRITPSGAVTTIAGVPTIAGLESGRGASALFNHPQALCVDASGNLYVADTGNAAIRKIDPSGNVTTLALTEGTGPAPTPTPNPPLPTPAPSGGGGGGGGGGSISLWFFASLGLMGIARCWLARRQR